MFLFTGAMTLKFYSWIDFLHCRVKKKLKWIVEEYYVSFYRGDNTANYHESFDKYCHFVIVLRDASDNLLKTSLTSAVAEFMWTREKHYWESKDLCDWGFYSERLEKWKNLRSDHNFFVEINPFTFYKLIVHNSTFLFSIISLNSKIQSRYAPVK